METKFIHSRSSKRFIHDWFQIIIIYNKMGQQIMCTFYLNDEVIDDVYYQGSIRNKLYVIIKVRLHTSDQTLHGWQPLNDIEVMKCEQRILETTHTKKSKYKLVRLRARDIPSNIPSPNDNKLGPTYKEMHMI